VKLKNGSSIVDREPADIERGENLPNILAISPRTRRASPVSLFSTSRSTSETLRQKPAGRSTHIKIRSPTSRFDAPAATRTGNSEFLLDEDSLL
jgi:hypothetical protein